MSYKDSDFINNCIIKLNQLFKDFEKTIRNDIKNINNISTKKGKISLLDALIYKFNYSKKDITKANIISKYNLSNDTLINRTTFYEKEKLFPLKTYENLIITLYDTLFNKTTKFIAVDGTFNNTNIVKN